MPINGTRTLVASEVTKKKPKGKALKNALFTALNKLPQFPKKK